MRNTIPIGLEKPLKTLHVTDSHIALADEYDNERKHALLERMYLPEKEKNLAEQIAYAKENCDLPVHTGDMFDFVSHANTVKAHEILSDEWIFFIAGNHEYSQYVGEAWESVLRERVGRQRRGTDCRVADAPRNDKKPPTSRRDCRVLTLLTRTGGSEDSSLVSFRAKRGNPYSRQSVKRNSKRTDCHSPFGASQ